MLAQKISNHLKKLAKKSKAIKKQFLESNFKEEPHGAKFYLDPLEEERYTKIKGLIHKYENRVLILLTLRCAAYCRFCTRQRCVSQIKKGELTKEDLKRIKNYLVSHPTVKEIILSGGDPLVAPDLLIYALKVFSYLPQIKLFRIGTRVPVSNPKLVTIRFLKALSIVKQPLYILIHFEHPDEITKETEKAIGDLRKTGAILLSQTVFLKGVNDSYQTLYHLFSRLIEIGVKPYYLFRCDPVKGAESFRVDFKTEVEIASRLRRNLSGLAWPTYAIDTPHGMGKIPVPLNFWNYQRSYYFDFDRKKIEEI